LYRRKENTEPKKQETQKPKEKGIALNEKART
jgi:hypothetical protein